VGRHKSCRDGLIKRWRRLRESSLVGHNTRRPRVHGLSDSSSSHRRARSSLADVDMAGCSIDTAGCSIFTKPTSATSNKTARNTCIKATNSSSKNHRSRSRSLYGHSISHDTQKDSKQNPETKSWKNSGFFSNKSLEKRRRMSIQDAHSYAHLYSHLYAHLYAHLYSHDLFGSHLQGSLSDKAHRKSKATFVGRTSSLCRREVRKHR